MKQARKRIHKWFGSNLSRMGKQIISNQKKALGVGQGRELNLGELSQSVAPIHITY